MCLTKHNCVWRNTIVFEEYCVSSNTMFGLVMCHFAWLDGWDLLCFPSIRDCGSLFNKQTETDRLPSFDRLRRKLWTKGRLRKKKGEGDPKLRFPVLLFWQWGFSNGFNTAKRSSKMHYMVQIFHFFRFKSYLKVFRSRFKLSLLFETFSEKYKKKLVTHFWNTSHPRNSKVKKRNYPQKIQLFPEPKGWNVKNI